MKPNLLLVICFFVSNACKNNPKLKVDITSYEKNIDANIVQSNLSNYMDFENFKHVLGECISSSTDYPILNDYYKQNLANINEIQKVIKTEILFLENEKAKALGLKKITDFNSSKISLTNELISKFDNTEFSIESLERTKLSFTKLFELMCNKIVFRPTENQNKGNFKLPSLLGTADLESARNIVNPVLTAHAGMERANGLLEVFEILNVKMFAKDEVWEDQINSKEGNGALVISLSLLQNKLLRAAGVYVDQCLSIGFGGNQFTHNMPIIIGQTALKKGEAIELKIALVGINLEEQVDATVNGAALSESKEGFAYYRAVCKWKRRNY